MHDAEIDSFHNDLQETLVVVCVLMGPKLFFSNLCHNCTLFPLALFCFVYVKEGEERGKKIPCHLYSGVSVVTIILNSGELLLQM